MVADSDELAGGSVEGRVRFMAGGVVLVACWSCAWGSG